MPIGIGTASAPHADELRYCNGVGIFFGALMHSRLFNPAVLNHRCTGRCDAEKGMHNDLRRDMQAKYRISEEEYLRALRLNAKGKPIPTLHKAAIALMLLILCVSIVFHAHRAALVAAIALIADALLALAVHFIFVPFDARRSYRSVKAASEDFYAELDEHGLRIASALSSQTLPWRDVVQWRHDETLILIYTAPRFFFVVPKRIEEQGFAMESMLAHLTRAAGPAVYARAESKPKTAS